MSAAGLNASMIYAINISQVTRYWWDCTYHKDMIGDCLADLYLRLANSDAMYSTCTLQKYWATMNYVVSRRPKYVSGNLSSLSSKFECNVSLHN